MSILKCQRIGHQDDWAQTSAPSLGCSGGHRHFRWVGDVISTLLYCVGPQGGYMESGIWQPMVRLRTVQQDGRKLLKWLDLFFRMGGDGALDCWEEVMRTSGGRSAHFSQIPEIFKRGTKEKHVDSLHQFCSGSRAFEMMIKCLPFIYYQRGTEAE